jgi:hypothetical protein
LEIKDLHWLAGLVEGEGCYKAQGGALALQIGMTDRDVIERAARILGTRVYVQPKTAPRKCIYATVVSGPRAAGWMMTLYSLMGERRKAKIKECLAAWRGAVRKKTVCRKGHSLVGPNLYEYWNATKNYMGRGCHTCRRAYNLEYARANRAEKRSEINAKQREAYHAFIGPRRPPGRPSKAEA